MSTLPFKLNQDRRHHIPRQRRKVTNWPAYDASLRQRGSLTVWFTEEAIAAWRAEGTVNLIGSGRDRSGEAGHTNAYARAATPVTAAQVWKARVRAARYWRPER